MDIYYDILTHLLNKLYNNDINFLVKKSISKSSFCIFNKY